MQSNLNTASHNHRAATETHDLRANHLAKHDTRRFAAIFPQETPVAVSADCGDVTHEQNDPDDRSRLDLVAVLDMDTCTTQATSVATMDQSSNLSAAQQIIACYRAVHTSSGHPPESLPTNSGEKDLPRIPDDQRSMYTLAAPVDSRTPMDMMWRPKPKVHMRRSDQHALMHAQSQAIEMMHSAGLKPTNKIQCRRRGCADILPGVEALKYHLHIHNIGDSAFGCGDAASSAAHEPFLPEYSTSNSKSPRRNHSRSKSSLGTQRKCSTTSPLPRKLSAGSLLPSLFSPRDDTSEVPHLPSLTTIAVAFAPDPSPSKRAGVRDDETPSTHASTPSRGRRRKGSLAVSVGAEHNPSIAMLLSPPSSPIMRGRRTPHATLAPTPVPFGLATDGESDNCASIPSENTHPVPERLRNSRSPVRALSPTRAMSPIRNGIRRILSIGCPDDVIDK